MAKRLRNLDGLAPTAAKSSFETIAPLTQLLDLPATRRFPHLLPDGTRAWSMIQAITWCAEHDGCHTRTIRRRIAKYKKAGEHALEFAVRRDKGLSRFFSQHGKAAALAAYIHVALRPPVRAIHQAILRNSGLLEVPEAKLPSRETVRVWLRSTSPTLLTLALEGQRTYRELMFSEIERGLLPAANDRSK